MLVVKYKIWPAKASTTQYSKIRAECKSDFLRNVSPFMVESILSHHDRIVWTLNKGGCR